MVIYLIHRSKNKKKIIAKAEEGQLVLDLYKIEEENKNLRMDNRKMKKEIQHLKVEIEKIKNIQH